MKTWYNLIPGDYTVTETPPSDSWTVSGVPVTVPVYPGDSEGQTQVTVTNTYVPGYVDVLKLTNGDPDSTMIWSFTLTGPGVDASHTTPPNSFDFGAKLYPGEEYRLCETGIPAGWTSMWVNDVNGNGVFDKPPDTVMPYVGARTGNLFEVYDPTSEQAGADNSTRCVDFTVDVGQTLGFIVDNQRGGGEPRTPGYWKNWSYCSGGNQYPNAQDNGGADEGWWTLDDLLPMWVGRLYLPGGDPDTYGPDYCADIGQPAINILNKSTLDGKKKANDAAYDLATHLLAAKLNLSAGACNPTKGELEAAGIEMYDGSGYYTDINDLLSDADSLLYDIVINKKGDTVPFDGLGDFLGPKNKWGQRAEALYLGGLLDAYNNAEVCTGDPTH